MSYIKLGIYAKDEEFAAALAMAIARTDKRFLIKLMSKDEVDGKKKGRARAAGISDEEIDFILTDYLPENEKTKHILLTEAPVENHLGLAKKGDTEIFGENEKKIFMYSGAKRICEDLIFLYCSLYDEALSFVESSEGKRICFCSREGGAGTTSLALGTAQMLKRYKDKSVIVLNFDDFDPLCDYAEENNDEQRNIEHYLHYLFNNKKLAESPELFTCSDRHNVNFFRTSKALNPLSLLDFKGLSLLLSALEKKYDYILIDAGKNFNAAYQEAISSCRNIFFVDSNEFGEGMNKKAIDFIKFSNYYNPDKETGNKIFRIKNKCAYGDESPEVSVDSVKTFQIGLVTNPIKRKPVPLDEKEEIQETPIKIYEDEDSFFVEDGHISISIDGDFGLGIKKGILSII